MNKFGEISSGQIKAARALLDWSQEDLAHASGLSIATVRKLELGHMSPRHSTTRVIRQSIEDAGLEFIEPDGVRRCHEDVTIYQGADGIADFLNDIQQTIRTRSGEIVIVVGAETVLFSSEDMDNHCRQFGQIIGKNSSATVKCLLTDVCDMPLSTPHLEFRSISKNYVDPISFTVYGDKHAMIVPGTGVSSKIISVRSVLAAQAARRQFYSMWEMATPFYVQEKERYEAKRAAVFQ